MGAGGISWGNMRYWLLVSTFNQQIGAHNAKTRGWSNKHSENSQEAQLLQLVAFNNLKERKCVSQFKSNEDLAKKISGPTNQNNAIKHQQECFGDGWEVWSWRSPKTLLLFQEHPGIPEPMLATCQLPIHSKIMTENGWFPKSGQSFPFFQNGLSKVATSQHGQVGWTEDTAKCHVFTKKHGLTLVGWFQDISSWYDVEITIPNRVDFFKESNPPRRFLRSESSLRVLAGFLQGRDLGSPINSCPTPEVATS